MVTKCPALRPFAGDAAVSDQTSIGARRAQVNAYRDAVDESPHGDRPPETPPVPDSSSDEFPEPELTYSAESIMELLERLIMQVDNSRLAQEASVASLERRLSSFVQDSTPPPVEHVTDHDHGPSPDRHNDIQHAMQEESRRSDFQRPPIIPQATPLTSLGSRRH
jgi:hypothetical protein